MSAAETLIDPGLSEFDLAAIRVICNGVPCELHEQLARLYEDKGFEEICRTIRNTIGCPLFPSPESDA
jgi:hypothetical protein